ncbi:MAG: hypothetical protein ACTHK3_13130 [Solirubrobacterales bacterium]
MIDRLRVLLDRPLDPSAARAILIFASAILVGFAALLVLAAGQADRPTAPAHPSASASPPDRAVPAPPAASHRTDSPVPPRRRQDPQDIESSTASRRAARALRSHRALQHVPYRDGELRVVLVGARGHRAVLRVSASTVKEARRGWRRFLRRYRDSGRAYSPVFDVSGDGDG